MHSKGLIAGIVSVVNEQCSKNNSRMPGSLVRQSGKQAPTADWTLEALIISRAAQRGVLFIYLFTYLYDVQLTSI